MCAKETQTVDEIMMSFDTDIFIWVQRDNIKEAALMDSTENSFLSVQTPMELLPCAKGKQQQRLVMRFISDLSFTVLQLAEDTRHWFMSRNTDFRPVCVPGGALMAATASENGMLLSSGNVAGGTL